MAANKAAWTGHFLSDLKLWTMNSNPIAALCYSHRVHPISRAERYYILFLQVLLYLFVAIMLTRIDICEAFLEDHRCRVDVTSKTIAATVINTDYVNAFHNSSRGTYCCELSMQSLLSVSHAMDPESHA